MTPRCHHALQRSIGWPFRLTLRQDAAGFLRVGSDVPAAFPTSVEEVGSLSFSATKEAVHITLVLPTGWRDIPSHETPSVQRLGACDPLDARLRPLAPPAPAPPQAA